jgi:hypothetical protein
MPRYLFFLVVFNVDTLRRVSLLAGDRAHAVNRPEAE